MEEIRRLIPGVNPRRNYCKKSSYEFLEQISRGNAMINSWRKTPEEILEEILGDVSEQKFLEEIPGEVAIENLLRSSWGISPEEILKSPEEYLEKISGEIDKFVEEMSG